MKIIRVLGIAGIAVLTAAWMANRLQRRQASAHVKLDEDLQRERWESEGGASHTGAATPHAVTTH